MLSHKPTLFLPSDLPELCRRFTLWSRRRQIFTDVKVVIDGFAREGKAGKRVQTVIRLRLDRVG
jgi:hypothetical protein